MQQKVEIPKQDGTLATAEKRLIILTLIASKGKINVAHKLLCPEEQLFISIKTLYARIIKHKINVEDFKPQKNNQKRYRYDT